MFSSFKKTSKKDIRNIINKQKQASLMAFLGVFFGLFVFICFLGVHIALATLGDYNKTGGDTLTAEEWNYLDDDFILTSGGAMTGALNVPIICDENANNCTDVSNGIGLWNKATGDDIYYNTGKIGVGETTPNARVEIDGTTSDNTAVAFEVQNSNNDSILYIRNDQKIGIGTSTNLTKKLTVNGSIQATEYYGDGSNLTGISQLGESDVETYISNDVTTNAVPYDNGTKLTSSNIYYSSGNIGIGTTTPNKKLHIYDSSQNAEIDLESGNTNNGHWGIYHDDTSDDLRFWKDSDDRFVVTDEGNVGIGTTTPTSKLDVAGTGNFTGTVTVGTPTADSHATTRSWVQNYVAGSSGLGGITDTYVNQTGDTMSGNLTMSGTAANIKLGSNWLSGDGGDEGVFVSSAGNVGIGTTNPQAKLEVNGTIIASTPTADNEVATKSYVDAAGGNRSGSSLGSDMLNSYFDDLGLFTPHTNDCSGSMAFVEIASGSGLGYCIEKTERSAQYWEYAKKTCADNGMRLPEPFEWKYACKNAGSLGLSNMTGNWEWASNFSLPLYYGSNNGVAAPIFGNSGCSSADYDWVGSHAGGEYSGVFRCVR